MPYFFGMGMASKFNCNNGFKNKNDALADGGGHGPTAMNSYENERDKFKK